MQRQPKTEKELKKKIMRLENYLEKAFKDLISKRNKKCIKNQDFIMMRTYFNKFLYLTNLFVYL